jgi:hypothetical protein
MAPESVLTGKLKQMKNQGDKMLVLDGTVADCEVNTSDMTIKKIYKMHQKNKLLQDLLVIETLVQNYTIRSWSKEAQLEFDPKHEYTMLVAAHKIWDKNHGAIFTPQPLFCDEYSITMTYLPWPRFVDFDGDQSHVWPLIKLFFYTSIKEGILHGDISKYNVLIHPSGTKICVVDFGLSQALTAAESHELIYGVREPGIAFELHNAWTNPGITITAKWWENTINAMDTSSASKHSGLYARSLINMTKMYLGSLKSLN